MTLARTDEDSKRRRMPFHGTKSPKLTRKIRLLIPPKRTVLIPPYTVPTSPVLSPHQGATPPPLSLSPSLPLSLSLKEKNVHSNNNNKVKVLKEKKWLC